MAAEKLQANQRLQHDCALMMTEHCVGYLAPILTEAQRREIQEGIYAICLAGIEAYSVYDNRMHQRLEPLKN